MDGRGCSALFRAAVMSCHAGSHSSSTVHLRRCLDEFRFRDDTHADESSDDPHTRTRAHRADEVVLGTSVSSDKRSCRGPHKLWEPPRGGHTDPW